MRMPAAGAKGSFTSIENSILINLFTANIIESSRGPPRLTPPHSHCSLPRACLAHCCAGICLETKGETRLIPSPAMWVCRAVSLFPSPSYYWHPRLQAVSEVFPGYVNSILLCYLFLSSLLPSPAPRVAFRCFFFFPKTSQGSHLSLLSQCSPLLQHKKELWAGECLGPTHGCMSCRPPHPPWLRP